MDKIELELTVTGLEHGRNGDKVTVMHVMQNEGHACEACGVKAVLVSEFTFLAPSGMFQFGGGVCHMTLENRR
jgi:hypothetical protein